MASPTQWTWVWVNSGSWWWTGRPGVLRFMELQSQTQLSNWTELNWVQHFNSIVSFRVLNCSAGIPIHVLAVFVVMLPKVHLTIHSRMSGSRWVTTFWLCWPLRLFLYSYSVYSCHLFLISSVSVRSLLILSFTVPIFAGNIPLMSLIFFLRDL